MTVYRSVIKNKYKKWFSLCIGLIAAITGFAQDSTRQLSAEKVMQLVKQYQPVAKQATILIEKPKTEKQS